MLTLTQCRTCRQTVRASFAEYVGAVQVAAAQQRLRRSTTYRRQSYRYNSDEATCRACPDNHRAPLNAAAATAAMLGLAGPASAATSDLAQGIANLWDIAGKSYGMWIDAFVTDLGTDSSTALLGSSEAARGVVHVPGLSSFIFLHGLLVGGLVAVLLAAGRLWDTSSNSQQQQQQPGVPQAAPVLREEGINPEVLAALRDYFGSHGTPATFHDPEVQAAVDEMRADVRNISKYRGNEKVMQAFQQLLDIENILERL